MLKKVQGEECPILESLLANMQTVAERGCMNQTSPMSFNNTVHLQQQNSIEGCSNHRQKKAEYYESEYPWIKYCESCALNLALCGKRIQKALSSEQMSAKIQLSDTLQSLTKAIKQVQLGHEQYSFLSSQLQHSRQWFVGALGQVDALISQLAEIRNQLQLNLQNNLNNQIKQIFVKQSLIVSKKIQLINSRSFVQCGFADLIGKQSQLQTAAIIQKAKTLIRDANDLVSTQQYKSALAQKVKNLEDLFQNKLLQIKQMQLQSPSYPTKYQTKNNGSTMSVNFNRKILGYRTSKTEKTGEDDIPFEEGKRLLTACSTVQHSGFTTPCELISSNSDLVPLGEISQNKKNSRTALQLKARCRSKSGQKKLQVNVRQSVQGALRKKLL